MSFILIAMNILRLLNNMIDGEFFLERYPGVTTPKVIKEALTQLGDDAPSSPSLGVILILLYGEWKCSARCNNFWWGTTTLGCVTLILHFPLTARTTLIGHATLDENNDIALAPLEACRDYP